jgi:glycosyltransferase involved in cell wall biosynthesis
MLDAFARNVPVVAMERATAGLPLKDACIAVPDDDAQALASAASCLLDDVCARASLQKAARRYLETQHSATAFASTMGALVAQRNA